MRILFLYNKEYALPLAKWLEEQGQVLDYWSQPLTLDRLKGKAYDLAISYSYRFLVPGEVIQALSGNIVNLHISFLPFNRGANPCEWSVLEGTPHGVTIHYMDERLDKGRIIAQRTVPYGEEDTLQECYDRLHRTIQELFRTNFPYFAFWPEMAKTPLGKGTYHSVKDFRPLEAIWQNRAVSVKEFRRLAAEISPGLCHPAAEALPEL